VTLLEAVAVTHRGRVRDHNEDTIAVGGFLSNAREGTPLALALDGDRPVACLVADGLGGHSEGARASMTAARYLADAFTRFGDPASVREAVWRADELVSEEAKYCPSWADMGTTVVAAVFVASQVTCVNVGDSRCYQLSDGFLVELSTDDSPPLPPGSGPDAVQTIITQSLGGGRRGGVEPHVWSGTIAPGDRFLLCSDGLTDYVPLDDLELALRDAADEPTAAVERLLDLALAAGGHDNVSIVLVTVRA
jgi:serine/threonine protein phosphatase PrpC